MEKWKVIEYYRDIVSKEGIKPKSGRVKIALIYPNSYEIAMQNLGFQFVYNSFNQMDDVSCERFVLDFYEDNLSIENQKFLQEFDIIAISINYEEDILNLIRFLFSQKIPAFAKDRGKNYPPVIAGGALTIINPNILLDIADIQLPGDFRPMIGMLGDILKGFENKEDFLNRLKECEFSLYKDQVRLAIPSVDTSNEPIFSTIRPCKGDFKDIFLIEASKSCKYSCRFCTTGYNFRPYRTIDIEKIIDVIKNHSFSSHIGIISAAFGDIKNILRLLEWMSQNNLKISVSSLRVDTLKEETLMLLKELGTRSVTIAEEVASNRLKNMISKFIDEETIYAAVEHIARCGIENLKLYYMFGFVGESAEDIGAVVERIQKISEIFRVTQKKYHNRLGKIKVSINLFNPKPFTPMQYFGLEDKESYDMKTKVLYKLKKIPNLKLDIMPYFQGVLQATIARAGKNIHEFYSLYIDNQFDKKNALKLFDNKYIYTSCNYTDPLPWEGYFVPNTKREILDREYQKCLQAIKG